MSIWTRNTVKYSLAIILIAVLLAVPLSNVAQPDIKVKAAMNKHGKIALRVLNNSGQDVYSFEILAGLGFSKPNGKSWLVDMQSDPHGMLISFVTDSNPIKNGIQKKFYISYKGSEQSINLMWTAKGKNGDKILDGSVKIAYRYKGAIKVDAKPFETAFNLIINNKSFKSVGTVGMSIWSPFEDAFVENVVTPTGWSYMERELITQEGAVFNGILIIPDKEEDFIAPNSTNSFSIDLSNGYDDYCVWLVSYTLFDTNDPYTQNVIKNGFINVQNPACSI